MTVISRKNHSFFFNGITDSIVVPEGAFSALGQRTTQGTDDVRNIISEASPLSDRGEVVTSGIYGRFLTIEAWVMPDCGGTIIEKEGQFKLSMGNVDTPGPATFEVNLVGGGGEENHKLTTATKQSNRYEGTVYPHVEYNSMQDSYNRFVNSKDNATDLNKNHRPLMHVVAAVMDNAIVLHVNGELMASKSIKDRGLSLKTSSSLVRIGGKGGDFRGTMEGIHLNASFKTSMVDGTAPLADSDTLLLYRFEEPIAPIDEIFTYSAHASSSGLSSLTITQADAKTLAAALTGKTHTTGTIDFTASPYSSGSYKVLDSSSGATVIRDIAHVPYNILVNPDAITPATSKPNQKPPERLRLHSINNIQNANPTLTVSSIHLDFVNTSNNGGLIGALHTSRTANEDNHFVVVSADLLIDSGTSKPYQPPHYTSQIIDRTGQMVIDESEFEQHGFVYSSKMATTTSDTDNPFAVVWPAAVSTDFQIGHSGRHIKNHVDGHSFLRMLPKAIDEIVDQRADGSADIIDIIYNDMQKGVDKQVSVNSVVDIFRDFGNLDIQSVVSSSNVTVAFNSYHGTGSPPAGKRKLIAIGGPTFDYTPFALKGPVPQYNPYDANDAQTHHDVNIRNYHVRPSKESRVALLHVPRLTALNPSLAPIVEIHYNAIDLTGASMSNTVQPLLMVEKTVPASDTLVSGSEYVYDSIVHAIASGMTLHAPGGYIDFYSQDIGVDVPMIYDHSLIGETSEGYSSDDEIDESLTPANYTPRNTSSSVQNQTPKVIIESVSTTGAHDSVFHKLCLSKVNLGKPMTDKGSYSRKEPDTIVSSPAAGQFDTGGVCSSTPIHEVFDVIDNHTIGGNNANMRLFLQPADRKRSGQLANVDIADIQNNALIMHLMGRAKVRSIDESISDEGGFTVINCVGIGDSLVSRSIDFTGKGSPDSHIVKEIEPNSPVVTVTLGGPGQGAMDTKPVYQPSILAHESYSTRRSYTVTAYKLVVPNNDTGVLHVRPLNNESIDMISWGTYGFPRFGRIYLQDGSSAKYASKDGTTFTFAAGTLGSGDFVSIDGNEYTSIAKLLNATGFLKGATSGTVTITGNFNVYNESGFGEQSNLENGSTINDRMHQSMDDVSHDYQLGTQYASTRAVAEIPLFSKQFFQDSVGPDNAFKMHIDATHTAHTYNPSPVGRRAKDVAPADREAQSAYAYSIANNQHVKSATITQWDITNSRVYISDGSIFPAATTSYTTYQGVSQLRYRKAFLNNGEWAWYTNDPNTDGYLALHTNSSVLNPYGFSEGFMESIKVGTSIFVGGPVLDDTVQVMSSDDFTPSSDFEGRGEYYHDAASVKTQGGNVDYGLRQYASAVEFKAGPESNPHAPKLENSRATGEAISATLVKLSGNDKAIVVTLSEEDFAKFPNLGYDTLANAPSGTGELGYEVQYNDEGTIYKYQYHGNIKTLTGASSTTTPENSITLVFQSSGSTYPTAASGVLINYTLGGGTYSSGHTQAMVVDGVDATTVYSVGDTLLSSTGAVVGLITAISSTSITVGGGTAVQLANNQNLHAQAAFPDESKITLARSCRNTLGTSVTPIVSDGGQYYREIKNSLNIDTGITVTQYSSTAQAQIEITNDTGKNVNNLHGMNVKKDDVVYYYVNDDTDTIQRIGIVTKVEETSASWKQTIHLDANAPDIPATAKLGVWIGDYEDKDAVLNAKWLNPYASGGLRDGDTVWANMSYNNPHAVEGLFAKSRGVLNEAQVWSEFDGGQATLSNNPRDSVPLENFLIGNTCLETARNYVQHVNRTVEENHLSLGLTSAQAPVVAYLDPYLSTDDHARVLLYDVAHDREFVAFQDIHMQVQSSAQAAEIGWPKEVVEDGGTSRSRLDKVNATYNGAGPSPWTTQIDVANGFLSQNPYIRSTQQSKFIESAYAHDLANRHTSDLLDATTIANLATVLPNDGRKIAGSRLYGKAHGHYVHTGYSLGGIVSGLSGDNSVTPRTDDSVALFKVADPLHIFTRIPMGSVDTFTNELVKLRNGTNGCSLRDPSTFFDTPDGTRVIPAFLCLKGIRSTSLDLSSHTESRLQHLPQWKDMDFVRRLTVDLGEVIQKDGVVNVLSAAEEVVRLVNQHAALNARLQEGSAHDPSPFWDKDNRDRGTHMGYIRAHIGREVEDLNGDKGVTVVIHSTVPGASGRNFCVWLDNSKGQSSYQPQFLIGHGGRWRNFWALPDEREGEGMHPAPMPLNKHGRPFAPVTTLQQYITAEESGEEVRSVVEFDDSEMQRAISDSISGKSHNTVNTESFDIKGSSSSIIKGLRTGTNSTSRINFGGLVASGVPGWAPSAGKWGFGKSNDPHYEKRYGTTTATSYSSYVPANDKLADNIGKAPIYGFRFKDNLGRESGIRLVYKKMGDPFANENTVLPDTMEEEVCIFFDDRSVTEGGFTIGNHMHGSGEATGRSSMAGSSVANWYGNRWRGVPAPSTLTACTVTWDNATKSASIAFTQPPFDTLTHDDKLGYFSYPLENGCFQVSQHGGANEGTFHTYTRRVGNVFYGVTPDLASGAMHFTPLLNWTTLVTDELIAGAMAAAINAGNEVNSDTGHVFDCTDMYAADGRTFREWGVSENAVVIRAYSEKSEVIPISERFSATLHQDQGIRAAHLEFGEVEKTIRPTGIADWVFATSRATTDALIDSGRVIDCGYIPYTLLQIRSIAKGPNANTATPILVDSQNTEVDITAWRENLKGIRFTKSSGDHILPKIDNPHVIYDESGTNGLNWYTNNSLKLTGDPYSVMIPQENTNQSVGERKRLYFTNTIYATGYVNESDYFIWEQDTQSPDWPDGDATPTKGIVVDSLLSLYGDTKNTRQFDGLRSVGSVFSEPIVYFRGGRSSIDHSVPLFFGGGFSGVTLDVNDGTDNDYSTFYTHPYANGPTGVAGIQNANEISTSYAMLDGNAMFAFFPGAALCNQHRGSITPPAFNKQNILSPDLHSGTTLYGTGEIKAKPVPLILRFPHPTARYEDHTDNVDSKTTYLIFGPGQAFPFTQEVNDNGTSSYGNTPNNKEPFPGRVIVSGSTWASVPLDVTLSNARHLFPNQIDNDKYKFMPPSKTYYDATAGFHWRAMVNWETPAGYCWKGKFAQRPEHGRHYGQQFNDDTPYSAVDLNHIHPKMHTPTIGFGITMGADTVWHMDGGFHPGGSWLDNQITFNPPHAGKSASRVLGSNWERANQIHPTAFRTSGVLVGRILDYLGSSTTVSDNDVKMEYIVVDATRCQNGEELATVVGAAINAFPGAGALKALGGTHMPSMGSAMRQDRYGWRSLGTGGSFADNSATGNYIDTGTSANQITKEEIPASGWLRAHYNNSVTWACYHSREVLNPSGSDWKIRFYLAPNRIEGLNEPEDGETWEDHIATSANDFAAISSNHTLFVWTKSGTMRFNNENASTRDHMTQVHFSGIADAVDRTKPKGAAGWHGERYSYLNSLKISTSVTKNSTTTTTTGYSAGLGAYHPMLGFSPYGTAGTVMSVYGSIPVIAPMRGSPESTPTIDGIGNYLGTHLQKAQFYTKLNLGSGPGGDNGEGWDTYTYAFKDTDTTDNSNQWADPSNYVQDSVGSFTALPEELALPQGLYSNAFLVISYECESALIAKFDRDAITANGDWLQIIGQNTNPITYAGTTQWDERFHGQDRFIAPANAGPNVEALIVDGTTVPVANPASANWAATTFSGGSGSYFFTPFSDKTDVTNDLDLKNATPGRAKTGDLLFDLDYSVGSALLHTGDAERNTSADMYTTAHTTNWPEEYWMGDVNALQMYEDSAVKNFSVENVVWKRMDGGNLSLPAINARGLGAVPWMTRVKSNTAYLTGEKLYGNVRFSFETTNSAMLPVLQAQELAHPELMRKHPYEVGNVLTIPNEEIQFQSISVTDEAGQIHKIEGGSPLGTIIRGFRVPENRGVDGRAPALANSNKTPNLKVQLPNPNTIPGNIVVRSGYDPVQAYQHETMGSGGMIHPDMGESHIGHLFDNSVSSPRQAPTYENHNWERIDPITYDSELGAWNENAPLRTSYELHDRTLFFHVCKMGHSHTHRHPTVYTHASGVENDVVSVTGWNATSSVLTIDTVHGSNILNANVFAAGFGTVEDNRKFLRVYNPTTDEGAVCTYIAQNDNTLEVVGDVNFATFMAGQTVTNLKVVPSYYVPAGSTRFFAARRLRDHSEVSGNSPDMAHTLYFVSGQTIGYDAYSKPLLTPMPFPRMGHHFVTPTMPMLPGHWAHPAYQSLYKRHLIDYRVENGFIDSDSFSDYTTTRNKKTNVNSSWNLEDHLHAMDAEINFSAINAAPSGPSDIHGGAFTLMFETGVRYDGYGVLASSGTLAGTVNKAGGHSIVLEAASEYTQGRHFPDPAEVGAYQIVIQPNVYDSQLVGYHNNTVDTVSSSTKLTSQQVNTVIGIKVDNDGNVDGAKGGLTLVLAKATQADVRGCEVFVNEAILDISNDSGSQFTNIPPLMVYNHVGVQLTETPAFTRRGFPYSKMFSDASPAHTLHIPWWSILHKNGIQDDGVNMGDAAGFRRLSQYGPEDYYMYMRSTFGSIGSQLTINGYPSMYLDIYDKYDRSVSLNPKCTVVSFSTGGGTIVVDDATLFPLYPYYEQHAQYTGKDGTIHSKALTSVSGNSATTVNVPKTLTLAAKSGADGFWDNIYDGAVVTLSHSYNTLPSGDILKNKKKSVFANILPDMIHGNQDTNTNYVPDAFLCMWHHNLGRPNTYFSDANARNWKGNAVDKTSYNSMPEHFETIHYHDYTHTLSTGPFDFLIKRPNITRTGQVISNSSLHDAGGTNLMLSGFWPCGSRGGPQASKLDLYGMAATSWNIHRDTVSANFASDVNLEWVDSDDDGAYAVSLGITTSPMVSARRRPYGGRNAVRQAYNKPRYDVNPIRAFYEPGASGSGVVNTTDYDAGPLIQTEAYSNGWAYSGGKSGVSAATAPLTHVGIMERQTNFTGMLNQDQAGWQVRYSDGRRMTRPFGTPVRTIRNPANVERDWWGDSEGKGETSLSVASQYYLVDWWGNERGEDVRRAPVRGFGIRPAWDCSDAYNNGSNTPHARIWNSGKPLFNLKGIASLTNGNITIVAGNTIPRFGGVLNNTNNNNSNELVDVFAPVSSLRVGDMGNGRGVRYPTKFNENLLTELSSPVHKSGIVLSHNTAEPLFGNGLLRPRNAVLQADEVKRGISAKLGIDDYGLLKSEATVSDRVEDVVGDSPHKDAVSRTSPRIGIDAQVIEGVEQNHIAINTEAHSLHTDRNVGQRVVLEGGLRTFVDSGGHDILRDADYTATNFARQDEGSIFGSVQRYSHTNAFRPYGGSYVLESKSYAGLFDDKDWGVSSVASNATLTSNPYQDYGFYDTDTVKNNEEDSSVKFLIRPIRMLDAKHMEVYRVNNSLHSNSPQYVQNYLFATSGGKYGMFTYETPNGRAATGNLTAGRSVPDGNGPYLPIFVFDTTGAFTAPLSYGPKLPGTGTTTFDSTSLSSTVSRAVISENTLQHHRADAPRRKQEGDTDEDLKRSDYSIKARFSQSLHGKGHKGDVSFSITDHSGDGT